MEEHTSEDPTDDHLGFINLQQHFALHPAPTLLEILQQGKVVQAQMVLNRMLSNINCQVDIPLSLVTALCNGNLSPPSNQVAHAFSIFKVLFMDAANMDAGSHLDQLPMVEV